MFFVEPKNGATVTSPLHMKFGSEGDRNRRGAAGGNHQGAVRRGGALPRRHRCRAVCLPGKTIVKGTPSWVHFGDGKAVFDTQLTPGKHKLALQLGDDLHDTMPGTCQEITVTVK